MRQATNKVRINNYDLLKTTGLRIVHINRREDGHRSTTVAYKGTSTLVELATAVTHPKDTFCRKVGTKTAVEAFQSGRTIRVPVPPFWQGRVSEFLKTMFEVC